MSPENAFYYIHYKAYYNTHKNFRLQNTQSLVNRKQSASYAMNVLLIPTLLTNTTVKP